jgi:nonsense-mediated mRNA decay protein 3
MTEFVVLLVEEVEARDLGSKPKHHLAGRGRMKLADVEVARSQDFGVNDDRLTVRTHLGAILRPGNRVLGYDLRYINMNAECEEAVEATKADVFLVKKVFSRKNARQWDLKRLDRDKAEGDVELDDHADMEAMKQELEEDPELRRHVNIYKQPEDKKPSRPAAAPAVQTPLAAAAAVPVPEDDDEEDENAPEVPLAELLEGLELGGKDD